VKKFDIITEADARVLQRGERVALARGGHITPLAQDTLRDRRIVVVRDDPGVSDEAALAPRGETRSVAIASDERGTALRRELTAMLRGRGISVVDATADVPHALDYAELGAAVATAVARGEVDAGVVVEAAGTGAAIAANKVNGIRAAVAGSEMLARQAREHFGANVLVLPGGAVADERARAIVIAWLGATMHDAQAIRRLAKLRDLERRERRRAGADDEP
jgi:ribose 5-phosphate isomerase B